MAVRLTILWVSLLGSSFARAEGPSTVNSPVTHAGSSGGPPPQLDPRTVSDPAAAQPVASAAGAARLGDGQLRPVRRPVAVIDLANDQSVRDVAYKVLDLLASHVELAPPAISDGAALVDKLPPDDEFLLIAAQRKRIAAEQNLAQRNFREAAIDAVDGQEILLRVTPRTAISLYADLAFALGQSRLGEKRDADAREAFALTYRLDHRTLDDLHYLPEVVQTFEAAKQGSPEKGSIAVRGTGQVWIDGAEVGTAPGEFPVTVGRHVVWLTGMMRETSGKEVLVTPGRPGDATIMDGPLTRPQKVARLRAALAQAKDPAARASAMAQLAAFVNVHEAILLSTEDKQIVWQVWRDRAPGFSAIHELGREPPIEILNQIAPPRPVLEPDLVVHTEAPEKRWYMQTKVHIGVAAVLLAFLGGYVWAHYSESPRAWSNNISGFDSNTK